MFPFFESLYVKIFSDKTLRCFLTKKVEEGRLELDEIVFLGSGGRHHEVVLTFSLPQLAIKHVLYTWENKLLHHEMVTLQQLVFRPWKYSRSLKSFLSAGGLEVAARQRPSYRLDGGDAPLIYLTRTLESKENPGSVAANEKRGGLLGSIWPGCFKKDIKN